MKFALKEIRKQKNISQQELAEKINSTQQTICRYELGIRNPSANRIIAISQALNCSINELFIDDEKATSNESC